MHLLAHQPSPGQPDEYTDLWQLDDCRLHVRWRRPACLLTLTLDTRPAPHMAAPARRTMELDHMAWLACEMLAIRLDIDDPLLESVMRERITLLSRLSGATRLEDARDRRRSSRA